MRMFRSHLASLVISKNDIHSIRMTQHGNKFQLGATVVVWNWKKKKKKGKNSNWHRTNDWTYDDIQLMRNYW